MQPCNYASECILRSTVEQPYVVISLQNFASPKQSCNSTDSFGLLLKMVFWKGINISWLQDGPRWRLEHLQQVFYMLLKFLHTFPKTLQANELHNRFSLFQSSLLTGYRDFGKSREYVGQPAGEKSLSKGKLFLETQRDHLLCLYLKGTSLRLNF